ncbi:hypothetical protein M438DRAFT_129942 [Aureobasidium pullulans EXF-150]|uniref:Uncharacterized protein n=1 Tax=Aureobasidium pullulans EXF-150 TaxID=1043002 RepID=A0A074XVN9_AURPU|nr:uncharacterized protein M438DRAFT_129942 [Aureobasidium pullulans EXF-150]KEQ87674.1 hypothetical protein M438DRAFT_129942 [Aureobasidium pullulans EXF-150]
MANTNSNAPQLLLLYTTAALIFLLPPLTTCLNIPPTPTLLLTTVIATSFFTIMTYLAMDACYTFTWIILKMLRFLLRFILPDLCISNMIGVSRSPGSKGIRQWWEVWFAVMVGVGVMVHIIVNRGGGWTSSLHKIEAKRAARRTSAAEDGGGEEGGKGSEGKIVVYASFGFLYTSTLMECRGWFERWWRGSVGHEEMMGKQWQTGSEATWELWSFVAATAVAGIVASVIWTRERRDRKARVARKELFDVKEELGEEGTPTIGKER